MKNRLLGVLLVLCSSISAFAGMSNAELTCISDAGYSVKGTVPGDYVDVNITVSKGALSAKMVNLDSTPSNSNAVFTVFNELEDHVWALKGELKETFGFISMYALPNTVVYKKTANGYDSTFTAKMRVWLEPISNSSKDVVLNCSLNYEI